MLVGLSAKNKGIYYENLNDKCGLRYQQHRAYMH